MMFDKLYSVVIITFSLVVLLWIIPSECPTSGIVGDIPSSLLPNLSMFLILCCGIFLFGKSFLKSQSDQDQEIRVSDSLLEEYSAVETFGNKEITEWYRRFVSSYFGRLLVILVVITSYVIFFWRIGFYATTAIYLSVSLFKLNRISFLRCATMSALLLVTVYVLFEMGLKVSMPRGFLF